MIERDVVCPSGMRGRIRALKVKEEKIWTDPKVLKKGRIFETLAKMCWLEAQDPGPYKFQNGGVEWENTLQGDPFYLFLQIVGLSYGDDYPIEIACKACRNPITDTVDLKTLRTQQLSDEARDRFVAGEPHTATMEGGKKVLYKNLLTKDEVIIGRIEESRDITQRAASTIARIVAIEGLGSSSPNGTVPARQLDIIKYCEDMTTGELEDLRIQMEENECGVDTEIELDCEKCFVTQAVDLPFDPMLFSGKKRGSFRKRLSKRKEKLELDGFTES